MFFIYKEKKSNLLNKSLELNKDFWLMITVILFTRFFLEKSEEVIRIKNLKIFENKSIKQETILPIYNIIIYIENIF